MIAPSVHSETAILGHLSEESDEHLEPRFRMILKLTSKATMSHIEDWGWIVFYREHVRRFKQIGIKSRMNFMFNYFRINDMLDKVKSEEHFFLIE